MAGHVYKRCPCGVVRDGSGRKVPCPKAHGSWAFVADVPVGFNERRRQQTKSGFPTKRDAEKALREQLARCDAGTAVPPAQTTVASYLTAWLAAVEPSLSPTASSNYRLLMERYVVPRAGHHRLTSVRSDQLVGLYRDLLQGGGRGGRPLSATTVRTVHRVLSKALSDAVRGGHLGRNPAAQVPLPKKVRPELQVWDRDQVASFLRTARTDRLYAAWVLALLCGLRRGELAGLRWQDVDLDAAVIRITSQRTTDASWNVVVKEPKGTSQRSIDLGPVVVEALRAHLARAEREATVLGTSLRDSGEVFSDQAGTPYHPDRFRELFQRLARRAGLPVIRLHDARHSCATLALDAGLHPKVVQQLLGHSSWSVTMDLYSHRVARLQREASQRIEELVVDRAAGETDAAG